MNAQPASTKVFDLTPEMLFRLSDGIEVVRLDVLERMVLESGPITGYAPWALESKPATRKSATRVWATIGADGLVLFDRKTRIAHYWAQPNYSLRMTPLKLPKHLVAASRSRTRAAS